MNRWIALAVASLDKFPVEKLFIKPRDHTKSNQELREILTRAQEKVTSVPVSQTNKPVPAAAAMAMVEGPTSAETLLYQKSEIGKLLYLMERHYAQKMKIMGKPCSCGANKHLPGLIALAEETIPMEKNTQPYYKLMDFVKRAIPVSTTAASASGQYDDFYPKMSQTCRDLRNEIMGSADISALFPKNPGTAPKPQLTPQYQSYLKALEEIKKEYPYPLYTSNTWERKLKERGIKKPKDILEQEAADEAEEAEEIVEEEEEANEEK